MLTTDGILNREYVAVMPGADWSARSVAYALSALWPVLAESIATDGGAILSVAAWDVMEVQMAGSRGDPSWNPLIQMPIIDPRFVTRCGMRHRVFEVLG